MNRMRADARFVRTAARPRWSAFLVASMAVAPLAAAQEGQWPRFRGPGGSGIAESATLPAQWTDADYNWKVKLPGMGHSSPVVWAGRIFLTAGDPQTALRMVLCLDAADGKVLWQRDYRSAAFRQHGDNSYATSTAAADADGVVVAWSTPDEVTLLALDRNGHETWKLDLGPYVGIHGSGSSPVIFGGLAILANEQEDPAALPDVYSRPGLPKTAGKSFVIAVDRKTGQTRWKVDRRSNQAPYSTPCLRPLAGDGAELIFSSTAHGITAIDPATGAINWEVGGLFTQRCVGSPVAGDGIVLAGDGYGSRGTHFAAVRPDVAAAVAPPPGAMPAIATAPAPAPATRPAALAYEIPKPCPLVPTPLVKDGLLFLWGDEGTVECRKAATGQRLWGQRLSGSFYGSPVWAAGRLYCIARNGDVLVLAAADKYELLGRVPLGEASYATPAVAGGAMYLRTRSRLYSLGGPKPASAPAPASVAP